MENLPQFGSPRMKISAIMVFSEFRVQDVLQELIQTAYRGLRTFVSDARMCRKDQYNIISIFVKATRPMLRVPQKTETNVTSQKISAPPVFSARRPGCAMTTSTNGMSVLNIDVKKIGISLQITSKIDLPFVLISSAHPTPKYRNSR